MKSTKRVASFCTMTVLCAFLTGCTTVRNSKAMTIPKSDGPVTVTSTARVQCWDILLLMLFCRLNMEMEASSGQRVSDFPQK
jgi:hypothetical protein